MAYINGSTSGLDSQRLPRKWPGIFSNERKPLEIHPWMKSLRELPTQHDGIKLFMHYYDDDRTPPHIEAVLDYCRDVSERDFRDTRKMNRGDAWLDDRTAPSITALANMSSMITPNAVPMRQPNDESYHGTVECDITDAHQKCPLTSTRNATCGARKYEERLTAWDLRNHLRQKRFNHGRLEDADRRLIHITNPSPCHMLALIETATEHQAPAIQDLLGRFVTFQTSMNVKISPEGYRVFQLEHHFSYFTLQKAKPGNVHVPEHKKLNRKVCTGLSFLDPTDEPDILEMYQAQSSFIVCGTDNNRWIAYNLEDTSFDPDREIGDDERDDYQRRDQISVGKFDANLPFTDAREYYLAIILIKVKHARNEIERVIRQVEASFRNHITCRPFSAASITEQSAISRWNEPMLELLVVLNQDLREKVDCWDRFQSKDLDYFKDPNATLPPQVIEHIVSTLVELENVYEELRAYGKTLSYFQEACEKLACRLDYRLSLQGGKIGEFTVLIISPVVIVSSIFAIPVSVLTYERNGRSFFLSVATVMSLLWLLLRLEGGWLHRQGWWKKCLRRGRTVRRRRDGSMVDVNEGEPSLLRRRSTHADFSRDRG